MKWVKRLKKIGAIALVFGMVVLSLAAVKPEQTYASENDKGLVVVLDPGHGGNDPGTVHVHNGQPFIEKNLNLAIALACKTELENYYGVTVYITRSDDTYVGLEDRVNYAASVGADVFISLHNNSRSGNYRGAEIYTPTLNYRPQFYYDGQALGTSIMNQLVACGLPNSGMYAVDSRNGTTYPDGSLADYYSVIRNSKRKGFTGIIVEHAYVSNATDCFDFLYTAEQLARLGVADATGIAAYYGLTKEASTYTSRIGVNFPAKTEGLQDVYRLDNPESKEHIYTGDQNEVLTLCGQHGWNYEGLGWQAPLSGTPVYRLYNPGLGSHLYTTDENEVAVLTTQDQWVLDNNGNPIFYSGGDVAIYRLYNRELNGEHLLTKDENEYSVLETENWKQEGIAIYAEK